MDPQRALPTVAWREVVEAWKKSGLPGREFARRRGMNPTTLFHWSRRLRDERSSRAGGAIVPVVLTGAVPRADAGALELVLTGGERLRVPPDFDPSALRRLVDTLRGGVS